MPKQKARTKYRNSKVYYYRKRTVNAHKKYKEHEKNYKTIIDKEQLKYRNKISKHLKDIKNKNPKEYWKVINKYNKNKNCQNQSAIGIDDLYQYFRDLNRSPEISDENNHMVDNEIANLQYEVLITI